MEIDLFGETRLGLVPGQRTTNSGKKFGESAHVLTPFDGRKEGYGRSARRSRLAGRSGRTPRRNTVLALELRVLAIQRGRLSDHLDNVGPESRCELVRGIPDRHIGVL